MKKVLLAFLLFAVAIAMGAQTPKNVTYVFTEASELTLVGKLFMDTPNPYHRVDTLKYKGFSKSENGQVRMSAGISVAFKTTSTVISVQTVYGTPGWPTNTNGISGRGYDLYIKDGGKWVYAASKVAPDDDLGKNLVLIKNMDSSEKECLLYLPLYSEVNSVKIGIEEGAEIRALSNPFRHRIAVFGSSFTHGSSTSRAGMTWPAQFSRKTGLQLLSLGCSGNCRLQSYFADALCAADVDAFIFDAFSNPTPEQIKKRIRPFIEKIQTAHPGKPLIFQRTIRREARNFDLATERYEQRRIDAADQLMGEIMAEYDDVYYVFPDATDMNNSATVDGVHPTNHGYTLWAESIQKPVLKILAKYGIR